MYELAHLQAVEPEALKPSEVVKVFVHEELDGMGFHSVTLYSESRDALLDYVAENWGDDDKRWWSEYVVARVTEFPTPTPAQSFTHTITLEGMEFRLAVVTGDWTESVFPCLLKKDAESWSGGLWPYFDEATLRRVVAEDQKMKGGSAEEAWAMGEEWLAIDEMVYEPPHHIDVVVSRSEDDGWGFSNAWDADGYHCPAGLWDFGQLGWTWVEVGAEEVDADRAEP